MKHLEKDNTGKGYLVWKWVILPFFKTTPPFHLPLPFYGKNLTPPHFFVKKGRGGEGGSNYVLKIYH